MTKKQHIVPQFYLRQFSINAKVCVYDIKIDNIYFSHIKNICEESYFYEYTNKLGGRVENRLNEVENQLALMEGAYSKDYFDFIAYCKHNTRITSVDLQNIVILLTFLLRRNKLALNVYRDILYEKTVKLTDNQIKNRFLLELLNMNNEIPKSEFVKKLCKTHTCFIYRNKTKMGFVTSDVPFGFLSLCFTNIELLFYYFPLTYDLMAVFEPVEVNSLVKNQIIDVLNESDVLHINELFVQSINNVEYRYRLIGLNKNSIEPMQRFCRTIQRTMYK